MNSFYFIFRLFLVITTAKVWQVICSPLSLCATESGLKHHGHDQICCGNRIYNRTTESGIEHSCCHGHGIYVKDNSLCCSGQLISRYDEKSGYERKCCPGIGGPESIFTPSLNQMCCNGAVKSLDDSKDIPVRNMDCCGSTVYHVLQERCCESKLNSSDIRKVEKKKNEKCCGGNVFNKHTHWCDTRDERIFRLGMDLCGEQEYNVTEKICCSEDQLVVIPAHLDVTDLRSIKCLYGHVYNCTTHYYSPELNTTLKINEYICGKDHVYDDNTQTCCNNESVRNKTRNGICCGSKYINTISYGCCADQDYNKAKQDCCDGKTLITPSAGLECCGPRSINKTDQVCCQMNVDPRPINKTKHSDSKCCESENGLQPYNEYTEECRKDGVCPIQRGTPRPKPSNIYQSRRPRILKRTSPFCKQGKKEQMKKTCHVRNALKAEITAVAGTREMPILKAIIRNWKKWRGQEVTLNITVKSKCIRKWRGKIVLYTNKVPKGNYESGFSIDVTNKDFIMRNSRKNRRLINKICSRS